MLRIKFGLGLLLGLVTLLFYSLPSALSAEAVGIRNGARSLRHAVFDHVHRSLAPRWRRCSRAISEAILRESRRFGLDPLLVVAVIEHESRFLPLAKGRHGEIGLMQIRPATGRWVAQKYSLAWGGKRTLRDPVSNIRLGVRYLAMLRREFPASRSLYLSAYNMGVGNVYRSLRKKVIPKQYAAGVLYRLKVIRNRYDGRAKPSIA